MCVRTNYGKHVRRSLPTQPVTHTPAFSAELQRTYVKSQLQVAGLEPKSVRIHGSLETETIEEVIVPTTAGRNQFLKDVVDVQLIQVEQMQEVRKSAEQLRQKLSSVPRPVGMAAGGILNHSLRQEQYAQCT